MSVDVPRSPTELSRLSAPCRWLGVLGVQFVLFLGGAGAIQPAADLWSAGGTRNRSSPDSAGSSSRGDEGAAPWEEEVEDDDDLESAEGGLWQDVKGERAGQGLFVQRFDSTTCRVCAQHGPTAPRLFIVGRADGLGNNVEGLIYGMAIAMKVGMNFGGAIHYQHFSHRIEVANATAAFFGIGPAGNFFAEDVPTFHKNATSLPGLSSLGMRYGNSSINVLFNVRSPGAKVNKPDEVMTQEFLELLRAEVAPNLDNILRRSSLRRRPSTPLVALHIRRGDVKDHLNDWAPGHYSKGWKNRERWTPNEWYYDMVARIRHRLPHAEVHAWSSVMDKFDKPMAWANETWFDGFRDRDIPVHIDTDELEAWAHMASAEVFVMAKSSFSWIPAVLNRGCVLYQPWGMRMCRYVGTFTLAPYPDGPSEDNLTHCMASVINGDSDSEIDA